MTCRAIDSHSVEIGAGRSKAADQCGNITYDFNNDGHADAFRPIEGAAGTNYVLIREERWREKFSGEIVAIPASTDVFRSSTVFLATSVGEAKKVLVEFQRAFSNDQLRYVPEGERWSKIAAERGSNAKEERELYDYQYEFTDSQGQKIRILFLPEVRTTVSPSGHVGVSVFGLGKIVLMRGGSGGERYTFDVGAPQVPTELAQQVYEFMKARPNNK